MVDTAMVIMSPLSSTPEDEARTSRKLCMPLVLEFREPGLEPPKRDRDQRARRHIEEACREPHLDHPEALIINLACLKRELGNCDDGGNRGVLEQRDEIVADAWQRIAQRDRQDDVEGHAGAGEPDR